MATDNGAHRSFAVSFPQPLLDQLLGWSVQAKRLGVGAEFLAALREVNRRLNTDPAEWGDPLREYTSIDAAEPRGMVPKWLLVWYGVHVPARQVIVRALLPAPGSPLTAPPT
jgi:hypothetical protein